MEKNNSDFMPKTLVQWLQAISLLIGITIILYNYFDKLSSRLVNIERRIDLIEYSLKNDRA